MSSIVILVLFGMAIALFSSYVKTKRIEKQRLLEEEKEKQLTNRIAKAVISEIAGQERPEVVEFKQTSE